MIWKKISIDTSLEAVDLLSEFLDEQGIEGIMIEDNQPLTEDELLKLRDAKLPPKLDRTRDLFIFMAYTGLAYVDMCHFNFKTMAEKQGNTYYINGERIKTGSKFYAPILPPAQAVLEKYNYKLPIITNQKLNDYLDLVREKLSMNKKITCHVARHSFATLLLTYDFTVEKTARALGHKDIKTTQVYAKVLKKTIVDRTEQLVTEIK
jgi:integrase